MFVRLYDCVFIYEGVNGSTRPRGDIVTFDTFMHVVDDVAPQDYRVLNKIDDSYYCSDRIVSKISPE